MRTTPHTSCPIRTCAVTDLRAAVATGDVEMADSTLEEFPPGCWVTVTPLGDLPADELLVVEITAETDTMPVAAMVTASMAWFLSQPTLVAVHHSLGRLLADSIDMHHPGLFLDHQSDDDAAIDGGDKPVVEEDDS